MHRRTFLGRAAAAVAAGYPAKSVADVALGGGTLTTVSDGVLMLPLSLPEDVPADDLAELAARFGLVAGEATPRPLNVTLWRGGGRTVLFDAGSGPSFVDTAGQLYDNLDAAGVSFDEITDVVFTHAHPDHIWGILDDFDEVPFPSASLWIGQREFEFWSDPSSLDSLGDTVQFFAVGAQRRLEAIADRLQFLSDGDEVLPGITARASFGHTPGHLSFAIEDGGDRALILGDAVTNAHLQFARPGWPADSDQEPETAATSRQAILSEAAASGARIVGYHLPDGGIGRVEADGEGYRFVADAA